MGPPRAPTCPNPVLDARCGPCILHDLRGAIALLGYDAELGGRIERRARRLLDGGLDDARLPSHYITAVHRILKEEADEPLPFRELRAGCNRVGADVARRVGAELGDAAPAERFLRLCLWAVAGNHLDFRTAGIGYGFGVGEVESMLRGVVARGFDVDETPTIERLARSARRVLYVPDNVGEIALDALLVREIRSSGAHVVVPYRGGPITSDATLEDFRAVGLDEAADEVFAAGPDTLGISLEEASPRLREELARADLVITKGQANFYLAYGRRAEIAGDVACLLTTKCDVISSKFGTTRRLALAVVVERDGALPQVVA